MGDAFCGADAQTGRMSKGDSEAVYEIRVRGVLGGTLVSAFPALSATSVDGDTVLSGKLVDQVALHGVLGQIECLGLELRSVSIVT